MLIEARVNLFKFKNNGKNKINNKPEPMGLFWMKLAVLIRYVTFNVFVFVVNCAILTLAQNVPFIFWQLISPIRSQLNLTFTFSIHHC